MPARSNSIDRSVTPPSRTASTSTHGDAKPSNGTFVNGRRITEPVPLTGDEHIRVGDTAFVLSPTEPSKAPATVVAPSPSLAGARSAPARIDEPEPAPRIGRSTVQRIVSDALRDEDKKLRRSTKVATGVSLLALIAAATVGALFATGTIAGGSNGNASPSITTLERATVLISDLDSNGTVTEIGSGTIIRPDGYILTNSHVAEPDAPGLPVEYEIGAGGAKPASIEISLFDGEAPVNELGAGHISPPAPNSCGKCRGASRLRTRRH